MTSSQVLPTYDMIYSFQGSSKFGTISHNSVTNSDQQEDNKKMVDIHVRDMILHLTAT